MTSDPDLMLGPLIVEPWADMRNHIDLTTPVGFADALVVAIQDAAHPLGKGIFDRKVESVHRLSPSRFPERQRLEVVLTDGRTFEVLVCSTCGTKREGN